jgi:hypothetical protein
LLITALLLFLPEECNKEENVEVTGAVTIDCLKRW